MPPQGIFLVRVASGPTPEDSFLVVRIEEAAGPQYTFRPEGTFSSYIHLSLLLIRHFLFVFFSAEVIFIYFFVVRFCKF